MAIWQFTFYPAPRTAIERIDGVSALTIAAFKPVDLETFDENAEWPNYWEGSSPKSYADDVGALLPARQSWSSDGLMFGDDKADDIELWDDDFRVRLDIRRYNETVARGVVMLASRADLMLVMGETGRIIAPDYGKLSREISHSRALKFAVDPVATLRQIAREHD